MIEEVQTSDVLLTRDGRPAAQLWPDSGFVHLNHGSFGRVPTAAIRHQRALADEMDTRTLRWMVAYPDRLAAARAELAPWLNVEAERLALIPNASGGISAALYSLPIAHGSEVLVTDQAYGAVRMGVERAARMAEATVRVVSVPIEADADLAEATIWAAVGERTSLIVMDHITSGTARRLPVGPLCARARAAGITTIVDGAHAPLLLTDPVNEADADIWVGNLHKFGSTPRGAAVLVPHPDVADRIYPLIDSWGAELGFPRRFDHQASDDYTAWLAAPTALRHLSDELGWDRIRAHATAMADLAVRQVGTVLAHRYHYDPSVELGQPIGPIRLLGLPAEVTHSDGHRWRARFLDAGFETAFTTYAGRAFWRVAPHAYTTRADLEAFVERGLPLLPPPSHCPTYHYRRCHGPPEV